MIPADLVQWLRGQLDDDERAALAFPEGDRDWVHDVTPDPTGPDHVLLIGDRVISAGFFEDDPLRPNEVEHIARHDPALVLREVEATRKILDRLAEDAAFDMPATKAQAASHDEWYLIVTARDVIKLLALPYADRPGYREEWRP